MNLRWTPLISAIAALSAASVASGVVAMPETGTSPTATNQEVASLQVTSEALEKNIVVAEETSLSISATLNEIANLHT